MLLAAVQVQSCVSSPSSTLCSLIYSELSLHSLTSGVYPPLVHSPAMGLPVFGLDVRLQHASSNSSWRGNVRSRAVFMYVDWYLHDPVLHASSSMCIRWFKQYNAMKLLRGFCSAHNEHWHFIFFCLCFLSYKEYVCTCKKKPFSSLNLQLEYFIDHKEEIRNCLHYKFEILEWILL